MSIPCSTDCKSLFKEILKMNKQFDFGKMKLDVDTEELTNTSPSKPKTDPPLVRQSTKLVVVDEETPAVVESPADNL